MNDRSPSGRQAHRLSILFGRGLAFLLGGGILTAAGGDCGTLEYRLKLRMREDSRPVEARFTLTPTAAVVTRNKVQKPRMGGWRLEGTQKEGGSLPLSMLLARTERLLYFSGPTEELAPTGVVVRFGGNPCRVWQVKDSARMGTYAYLVEVRPNLLALSYLSAGFAEGELASIEIQLEKVQIGPCAVAAEEGQQLLRTLRQRGLGGGGIGAASSPGVELVQD